MSVIAPQPGKPVEPDEGAIKQQPKTKDEDLPKAQETPSVDGGSTSGEGGAHGWQKIWWGAPEFKVSRLSDQWAIGVQMLATTDAGSSYVLTLVVPASRFQRTIDNQRLPPQWSPVILDQNWTIVARGMTPEKFIGQTGASYELKDTPESDSARAMTREFSTV